MTEREHDADVVIANMKTIAGLKTDIQLANILGVSKVTVAAWRRRKAVPIEKILKFCNIKMVSFNSVVNGDSGYGLSGAAHEITRYSTALSLYFYERVRENILYIDRWNTSFWWSSKIPMLIQYYENQIVDMTFSKQNEEADFSSTDSAAQKIRETIDNLGPTELVEVIERLKVI